MAYRHSHPPFHIPEAAPRTTNGNGGGGSGGLGPYPPYPQHQQQQQGLPPPPLPSPDYYSYLIQTPDGLGGQPTLGADGGGGSAGGVGGEENRQQRAAWAAAAEARGGWDPSMFNTPPGESGGSELPTFLRPPSLGDINRMTLSADVSAAHRAVDEWNLASFAAGAAGVRLSPGEGFAGADWGWGGSDAPFPSPGASRPTLDSQESFRAAAAFVGATYPSAVDDDEMNGGGGPFSLAPSPASAPLPSFEDDDEPSMMSAPQPSRSLSDPLPPSGPMMGGGGRSSTVSTAANKPTPTSTLDSGRASSGPSSLPSSALLLTTPGVQQQQRLQQSGGPTGAGTGGAGGPSSTFQGVGPGPDGRQMPGLYSSSGFDVLGVLSRVIAHPTAQQLLGPVDFSCSFIVVDVTKNDFPIAYASPSFSVLTGYENKDIVGRNCRFLQAPGGDVQKGELRKYTDNVAVSHLHDRFSRRQECQASLINYKRGGTPFLNLVTIVPISHWHSDEVEFLVGFQVDLVQAPNAILASMQDGTYQVSYQVLQNVSRPLPPAGRALGPPKRVRRRRELTAEMRDVVESSGRESAAAILRKLDRGTLEKTDKAVMGEWYKTLAEHTDDFAHVLSLKGQFLYASPFVRNVLGYEAEELQGKFIGDLCHPSDIVSVMRELKEATQAAPYGQTVKTVNYLCRVRRKVGGYLWLECTGRLHVEPGKGRKVVVLTGRERVLPRLEWSAIGAAGGLGPLNQDEGWGMLSNEGLILYASAELQAILGARSAGQLLGDSLFEHVPAPLGPPPRATTTMSPSQLQPSADDAAHARIKEALATVSRGLPKNGGITVRHSILLPAAAAATAGSNGGGSGGHSSGRHSSAASSSRAGAGAGSSGGRPIIVLHEVATTFYAVHLDPPWPDPRSIERSSSSSSTTDGSATPESRGFGNGGGGGSRASPVGSPETDSFPLEEGQGPSLRRSKPPPIVFQLKVVRPPPPIPSGHPSPSPSSSASPATTMAGVPTGRPPLAEPTTDVFAEISLQRESSWVYELQQLKRSNGRLRKELAAIRASRQVSSAAAPPPQKAEPGAKRKRSTDPKPPQQQQQQQQPMGQPTYLPAGASAEVGGGGIGLGLQPSFPQQPVPTVADVVMQRQRQQQQQQQQQAGLFDRPSPSSISPPPVAGAALSGTYPGRPSPPSSAQRMPPTSAFVGAGDSAGARQAAYQASLYRAQSSQLLLGSSAAGQVGGQQVPAAVAGGSRPDFYYPPGSAPPPPPPPAVANRQL